MKRLVTSLFAVFALILTLGSAEALAEVKLSKLFSDHMVLQREQPAPVWGTAAPGEVVTVKFAGQTKTATADATGKWLVRLDTMPASAEPRVMTVAGSIQDPKSSAESGKPALQIQDVLVGEVWVGSGQSNMAMPTGAYTNRDAVLALMVTNAPYPRLRLGAANRSWQEATANNVNAFSALLFAFGVRLQTELDVPVGLLVGAVGGTPSGNWISGEALKNDAACQELLKSYETSPSYTAALKKYQADLAKYQTDLAVWKQAAVDAAKEPSDPAVAVKPPVKPAPREPSPPPKAGPTSGVGNLYEAYIRPFIPYAIRGVLWDQGESGTAITGVDQYTLMGALIRGWRKDWGGVEFPFIYVQKPSGFGCAWDSSNPVTKRGEAFMPLPPAVPNDGAFVETHIRIMSYPKVGMAISSDLGSGLHPLNKSGYGHRAADVALGMVYGKKIEYYGPAYDSHKVEGDKVRVRFQHVGQGLAFKNGNKLQGFALAGEDKVFHWADATIDGDTVVLSSAQVSQPVAVRYAWATVRSWANLFNKDGLPAIPFRTDGPGSPAPSK